MDFPRELQALIDKHLNPASIYSRFLINAALMVAHKQMDSEIAKFPEHAEHDEENTDQAKAYDAFLKVNPKVFEDA